MAMMNAQQYRDSLAKRKPLKVYLDGELLAKPLEHPYIRTSMNTVALTYEMAHDPEHRQVMTAKSALTGETSTASATCTRAPTTSSTRCACSACSDSAAAPASSAASALMR